jgi:serine/threonine-protein kinase RsbW
MGQKSRTSGTALHLHLASLPKNIARVETFLKRVQRAVNLDEIQFHKVMVALTEAVNNAIVHGNRADPAKEVQILCDLTPEALHLRVLDQGGGFDPASVDSPLKEENLLRESGRGIFLMRTLMDKVSFSRHPDGMEVHLVLRLDG